LRANKCLENEPLALLHGIDGDGGSQRDILEKRRFVDDRNEIGCCGGKAGHDNLAILPFGAFRNP
jgi:hypothetical protein